LRQGNIRFIMKRATWVSIAVIAVGLAILLSATNLFLGSLNQDEGWYLYAARQITEGKLLYRDFMFTQGPALPYIYGVLFPIVEKYGVAGGRLITALFGLASAGCAAWLAARAIPKHWKAAALCAFILTGVNVYQSYFTVIVKTYALCAFFLTAGFVALSYTNNTRRGALAAFWGGFLLALAACTRLSAGIALPVAGLWLLWNRKKVFSLAWVAFGLGGGFILLVGLGVFFLLAPENTEFALFGYHAGRAPGSLTQLIALKAGFISRFVQAYFVFFTGLLLTFALKRLHWPVRERGFEEMTLDSRPKLIEMLREANAERSPFARSFLSLLWLSGALITLVHVLAPFPYDDYQVIVYPLLAAALAVTLAPHCAEKQQLRAVFALLLICTAASFSSPINQDWLIRGRDRIWWKFKETPDVAALRQTGDQLRNLLGENGLLLTQDTYLAIESGAGVPHGMEMGPFCYYPDMPSEQAEKLNLLNRQMMVEILTKARPAVAAFSGYGLTIRSPEVAELSADDQKLLRAALESGYKKTGEVPNFGQAYTVLEVFERK
jgi:4-amino-4-deoxy-L-arabinose transferase-like glycosyltransferase